MFMNARLLNDQSLENATGVGAPPWTWPKDEQVIDLLHKGVYAFVISPGNHGDDELARKDIMMTVQRIIGAIAKPDKNNIRRAAGDFISCFTRISSSADALIPSLLIVLA